jgi:outer membrane protein TolC
MMRRFYLLSFFLFARAAVFAASPTYEPEILTFDQSVDRAYRSNPHLLSAQQDIAIAQVKVRQAKSLFYPNVNLSMNYVRYRNETFSVTSPELGNVVLEAPLPNAAGTRGNPLADDVYLGRIGFRQTLWAGGRIGSTYQLSRANLERASSSQMALREEIKLNVARSFYSLLADQEKEKLYLTTLKAIEKMPPSFAVFSAKAELRRNLSAVQKELRETRFDYLESMGTELFTDVRVVGTLDMSADAPVDLQRALSWAKQNRTELRASQFQQEVDRLAVSLSLAERYPVFLLGGAYEVRNNELPLNETNWNAVLSMNIPLFDGFASLARVRESRFRADQGRLHRVQLEDQIERDVRSAYEDFTYWTDELDRRQKETQSIRQNWGSGSASRLDYIQWNLQAELGIIEAKVERTLASALLKKSIGPEPQ